MKPKPRKHLILLSEKDFHLGWDDAYLSLSKLVETDYHVIYYKEGDYSDRMEYTYHIKVFSDFHGCISLLRVVTAIWARTTLIDTK